MGTGDLPTPRGFLRRAASVRGEVGDAFTARRGGPRTAPRFEPPPGNPRAARGVRGDYESFAAAELPRLSSLGYPPFGHVASLTFEGSAAAVSGAVESRLRPALGPGVEMSPPVPVGRGGENAAWRVLLRSRRLSAVARAATLAAREVARMHGLAVRVEVDPEEV